MGKNILNSRKDKKNEKFNTEGGLVGSSFRSKLLEECIATLHLQLCQTFTD